jgi:hypothetical protein
MASGTVGHRPRRRRAWYGVWESGLAIVKNGSQSIGGQLRLRLSLLSYYDFFYF